MTPPAAAPLLVAALALAGALTMAGCGTSPAGVDPAQSSPAPTATSAPSGETTSSVVPATWDAAHITAECTARSATGPAMGVTDTGFSLGTVTFAPESDSLCFFDGLAWWRADLVDAPIRAAQLTGVGWFSSQVANRDGASGRFLFGLTSSDDTTIQITVDGAPVEPISVGRFSPSTTELPILAKVPATGTVVVRATKGDTVVESVTARAAS
jgi:hypothetical protein